jgi:ubiquitin carboxyl-terminal hydrolase 22/27/51
MMTYELSAVIVHKGEINSGHYVNYARKGSDWFLFDDSKVVLVDEAEVLAAEAYLLVYVIEDLGPWAEEQKAEGEPDGDDD